MKKLLAAGIVLAGLTLPAVATAAYVYTPPAYFNTTNQNTLHANGFTSPTQVGPYGSDWKYVKTTTGGCTVTIQAGQPGSSNYYVSSTGPFYMYGYPVNETKSVQLAIGFSNLCN